MNAEKTNVNGNGCADVKDSANGGGGGTDDSGTGNETQKPTAISTDVSLPNDVLERLFQRYSIKQRRAGLECFLATSVLFDLWVILAPEQGKTFYNIGISCVFLVLNLALALFLRFCGNIKWRGAIWEAAPHLAWVFAITQLALQLFYKTIVTTRDFVGYAILLNFLVYVTLPVPLYFAGILLGIGSFTVYVASLIGLARSELYFWHQQIANGLLMGTAAAIGLLCYYLGEAKQRRAFLEAKKSLEVKMVIEEQSAEQERLLLSVLPEHVAVKVRQDLGSNDSEQFKKIYMSRHENVSILYADIVGFTAISSTYSAQDLVKMLNELFARFDRLAEKYHQLRIKILGDCYYCISGANIERADHAVLCVHMGLSMVKAIKYVQQKTNSPVDMRVGIHTGAILAGILGQRQWQYDVYSKDVELANKMESSGMAGRVHISEKTLQCLSGEFEVEPAYGEKREETLRIAGLKTYFIKKVLIPFAEENDVKTGEEKSNTTVQIEEDGPSETFKDEESKCNTIDDEMDKESKEEIFKNRLRKELVSRDGHGELSKDTTIFLRFKNKELESSYEKQRESMSSVPLIASLLVHIVASVYSSFILPSSAVHFFVIIAPIILTLPMVWISVAESFPMYFSEAVVNISKRFNDISILRRIAAILTIAILGCTNLFDMLMCASTIDHLPNSDSFDSTINASSHQISTTTATTTLSPNRVIYGLPTEVNSSSHFASTICTLFPSYFSNYAILILIATSVVVQLTHVCKFILMLIIAGLHCYMNIFQLDNHFRIEENGHSLNVNLSLRYSLSALLLLVSIALGLLSRHMDKEDRVIFKWKSEVAEQKETASDMRRRNEKLVYNILPIHVAEYFIRNKSRSYDELYSQSYDEVGVLFASMPNFSDFYSEDAVNNQGLECLRFLNEVISDFDALLGTPQFQDVIKIKTIGSTYMAASGLNNVRTVKADDSVAVRWNHLATLVEFALELKKALQCINEQSFNHFVLKMGINHGPITAGVIGARKPHYDIWGNTVNVASRMESTGKAGAIQVTQETCEILQTFGYTFEQRGLVAVKGKGQLMTYYLIGKRSDGAQTNTTSFSPSLSHNKKKPNVSNPASPKTNVIQPTTTTMTTKTTTSDLNSTTVTTTSATSTPQAIPKTATSPLSSCSNSPSSVRINQNYDPNNVKKEANDVNHQTSQADGNAANECDLDNLEDGDNQPLLNANNETATQIFTKRTNNRCEKADQESVTKADSDNESDTLIANSHN